MSKILHYLPAEGYTPAFGRTSQENLDSCCSEIQTIAKQIIEWGYDISVTQGHRAKAEQDKEFACGNSHLCWPKSYHNQQPSQAFDLAPYFSTKDPRNKKPGIPWDANFHEDFLRPWFVLHGLIMAACKIHGIELYWGGWWKGLKDYPHYQTGKISV